MLRRSPRALLIWAAAIAVLLGTARIVGGDLAEIHRQATSLGPLIHVVVASRDLPLGATIESGDVESVTRHESQVSDAALHDVDDVVGRIVVVPLVADTTVLAANVADSDRDGTDAVVPDGMRVMRVPLDVAVRPRTGDVVDLIATFDATFTTSADGATSVVASAATVLTVEVDDSDISAPGPAVTVLVTAQESRQLAFALTHGVVTLAVAPPEEACCVGE
ncbi:MAG: Flp pilus assembly protein CpaB [Acidimicrobiia bacterium]|nr:Flp pilus assembly protein CpaB [Acidimicrobiia bacterium]